MQEWLEFFAVWTLVHSLRLLPRGGARAVGAGLGRLIWRLLPRLRRVGMRNLQLAYPEWSEAQREATLHACYLHLGRHLAEFCQMSRYTRKNTESFIRYEGLAHYLDAQARGRGVLVVTAHLGAWELSSYWHSLMGHPMGILTRKLDNERIDRFVNGIRSQHGNRVLYKDDFARGLIGAMRRGETVGILMDTNMTPPQGVFVPYFGHQACTGSGLARIAQKTGAAVLPGFLLWEPKEQRYVLHFGKEIELAATGDEEADAVTNTARFTAAVEQYVRHAPSQWLWIHRRWKTRPPGEAPLY